MGTGADCASRPGPPARLVAGATAVADLVRTGRDGPWRVVVVEDSMRPTLEPGDWLLVDPTIRVWPRRGTIVVIRDPAADMLSIKRVAARPGDVIRTSDGPIRLTPTQAWLLGDDLARSVDSRRYGPVELDRLVARAWLRYGPGGRARKL